jgi:hypothetical protein
MDDGRWWEGKLQGRRRRLIDAGSLLVTDTVAKTGTGQGKSENGEYEGGFRSGCGHVCS